MGAERPQKKFDWRDVDGRTRRSAFHGSHDWFCQGELSKEVDEDAVIPEGTSIHEKRSTAGTGRGIKRSQQIKYS